MQSKEGKDIKEYRTPTARKQMPKKQDQNTDTDDLSNAIYHIAQTFQDSVVIYLFS